MIWPDAASFAFTVSVDVDGDLPLLAEDPGNIDRHKSRSSGLYGPEHGAPRLLRALNDLGVSAQWFFPGAVAERYPELVSRVHEAGHGTGVHGHRHLNFDRLTLDQQIEEMTEGRSVITSLTGTAPTGFRTPSGEWGQGFLQAMESAGFRWSSSLASDDFPFHLTGTDLVEIPFRYELEDQQYLGYNLDPPFPPGQSRITPLEFVDANWKDDVLGAERYGTLAHLRLNAEVMGFPGRVRMLRSFLTWVKSRDSVWFATMDELCDLQKEHGADPSHPYALFARMTSAETP